MGVSKEQTVLNRQAILAAAERLFRERGVDGVGLVELMKEAGFTQGGFYNHFESKQALAAEVVNHALAAAGDKLAADLGQPLAPGQDLLRRQLDYYFSSAHRDDLASGCAIGGMAGEVARLNADAQLHFAQGMEAAFSAFGALLAASAATSAASSAGAPASAPNSRPGGRARAIALYCEMVGALMLSRAVGDAVPALSEEILRAARDSTFAALI
ncbi:TetR/AcrR family transcriptional regulator [Rugamonas sp.]|uniref:TetR/AcrR family transcriptional regulator n=1 Tax=Rugamonas sp. TaxID=1926287 RepID=UPI0025F14CD1|nr:TetR/AcrR family transcriptional regulator [Rugamonas sp.]